MIGLFAFAGPALAALGGAGAIGALPYLGPVLRFLTSGPGRILSVIAIVFAAYGFGWLKGDAHGDAQCVGKLESLNTSWRGKVDQAAADFARLRKERDESIDADIEREVARQTAEIKRSDADKQKEIERYAEELRKRGDGSCRLGPADRVRR